MHHCLNGEHVQLKHFMERNLTVYAGKSHPIKTFFFWSGGQLFLQPLTDLSSVNIFNPRDPSLHSEEHLHFLHLKRCEGGGDHLLHCGAVLIWNGPSVQQFYMLNSALKW